MTDTPQHKDFPAILEEIMAGKRELPNYEEVDLAKGVANIACLGWGQPVGVKRAKVPGASHSDWARYFLDSTQGGALDGAGMVMIWGSHGGRIGKFAICVHKHTGGGTREQKMRGWHPGRCEVCGLDLSVDSGD